MKTNDEALDAVIFDGIRFLESLTKYYGADRGMEMWNSLGEVMGKEVKGKVFFAMLTGETGGRVRFRADRAEPGNAVAVIKTIRTYTGLGLKEAKDLWDLSKSTPTVVQVNPNQHRDFAKDLRELGCAVS